MEVIEKAFGSWLMRMLMPEEAPTWYESKKSSFPEAPPGSLHLLGEVTLEVSDLQRAQSFYAALAGRPQDVLGGGLRVRAGAAELRVAAVGEQARPWPGHLYVWVRDLDKTLERVRDLERSCGMSLVDTVHNLRMEDRVDALELEDFDGNRFVLNQVPKGMSGPLERLCAGRETAADGNLVALIEALQAVPTSTAPSLGRFFHHYFGAAVKPKDNGWQVNFSPDSALRQTLCFVDMGAEAAGEEPAGEPEQGGVCFYMPSQTAFREAFEKLSEAGLVDGEPSDVAQAEERREFQTRRCVEPRTGQVVLHLRCVVRSPLHSECPVPAAALQ